MRTKSDNGVISAKAISGTRVVILGLDVMGYELLQLMGQMSIDKKKSTKLKKYSSMFIGFSISRTDVETGQTVSLNDQGKPIQKFMWGDYSVEPGKTYEYSIRQLTNGRGFTSAKSVPMGSVLKVQIKTEDPSTGTHGVYFNRGVSGSHEYNTTFGKYKKWYLQSKWGVPVWRNIINPRTIPDGNEALKWLSRGMEEALLNFISQASGSKFQLRLAVYEFTHKETIAALAAAVERGVDVKVIRHCKGGRHPKVLRNSIVKDEDGKIISEWVPDSTTSEATKAIRQVGFTSLDHAKTWHNSTFIERRHSSALMHNKFIILLEGGKPTQVWTGSTNFTDGGIYGQANVAHIVRDVGVASRYLTYWNALSLDPPGRSRSRQSMSDDDNTENIGRGSEQGCSGNEDKIEPLLFESLECIAEEPLGMDEDAETESVMLMSTKKGRSAGCEKQRPIANQINEEQPDIDWPLAANSSSVIFSPRLTTGMLQWYADRMKDASSIHLTAPFGVSQQFGEVLVLNLPQTVNSNDNHDGLRRSPRIVKRNSKNDDVDSGLLRYVLYDKKPSEKISAKAKASAAKKEKSYVDYFDFKNVKANRIAYGAVLSDDEDGLHEDLTGLTTFVDFIHLKCLLIDVTTDHPTVITGSANFSEASIVKNDENMLVIHGDTAVADVYFTEYMRLFNHFYSRDYYSVPPKGSSKQKKKTQFGWGQVVDDESWLKPYFDPSNQLYRERRLLR